MENGYYRKVASANACYWLENQKHNNKDKEDSFLQHFITFFFWKFRFWSVRTRPENFGGLVRKDLNLLGTLEHYIRV